MAGMQKETPEMENLFERAQKVISEHARLDLPFNERPYFVAKLTQDPVTGNRTSHPGDIYYDEYNFLALTPSDIDRELGRTEHRITDNSYIVRMLQTTGSQSNDPHYYQITGLSMCELEYYVNDKGIRDVKFSELKYNQKKDLLEKIARGFLPENIRYPDQDNSVQPEPPLINRLRII